MSTTSSALSKVALGVTGAVGLYAVLIGVLLTPSMQRFALYAHYFNTLFRDNLNDPESFGFAKNQVTPFNLQTPDGETLYAWHVLPLDVYTAHEGEIRAEQRSRDAPIRDVESTVGFRLLKESSDTKVLVSFHGNAGHIAQNARPATNRYMAAQPNTHVLTIDYRGFGLSSGSPTEAGLIADGVALVDWVMNVAGVPPERIVILGQSLGTAVSSAVALHFADLDSDLIPSLAKEMRPLLVTEPTKKPTTFAGVVLAAPFNSVPTLLLTYRVGGLLPLLLPLRPFPAFANMLTSHMVDKWLTAERLKAYYDLHQPYPGSRGSLQILHALNDADIPYHQTEMICRRVLNQRSADEAMEPGELDADECIDGTKGTAVLDVKKEGRIRLRFELVGFGGHNKIITHSPVHVAVARAFSGIFE